MLRDYHSPNLLWLAQRDDIARIGILDFQDAVIGPAAYDVASLLQDARVDVPEAMEMALLGRYVRARLSNDRDFDPAAFTLVYATLAAQRATKILGIFARLNQRDRQARNICVICLAYGTICGVAGASGARFAFKAWYAANVPAPARL